MKRHFLLICIVLLSACSNLPPLIENPPAYDISYREAIKNIAHFNDAPVRWGGVIVGVENEQNFSLVQVLNYPLNSYGRPQLDKPNESRFLIKSTQFLDPAVYKKDLEITVAGILKGDIERTVGNKILRVPIVFPTEIYLWPVYDPRDYYGYPGYGYGGFGYGGGGFGYGGFGYNYPYYGISPYYRGRYYWPYRR